MAKSALYKQRGAHVAGNGFNFKRFTLKQLVTISIIATEDLGILVRLAGIFSRRRILIRSLSLTSSGEGIYCFIVLVKET